MHFIAIAAEHTLHIWWNLWFNKPGEEYVFDIPSNIFRNKYRRAMHLAYEG